jgi:hypothetical protein
MTTRGYGDRWWEEDRPADLEKTSAASAASSASTSKDSYTRTIKMSLVRGKEYKFWFKYKHENPDTKEVTLSDSSPIWKETFAIPNLTKAVLNLTLTQGYKSYGVKFDLDPLSVHEDIVIYESLTSTSLGNEVYRGTSTNVTIPTNSIATRWITVRTRDKWDDLNKTDTGPLPVTPLNPDPDTTYTVDNPATASADASIDPKDLSGFSLVSTITWSQSTNVKTAGYAIRWSTNNPDTVGVTPLWEYASVSGRDTLSFTATGLIPNTTYYYQVAGVTPYDVVDWTGVTTRTFIASDADGTAAGALARLKSFIAIGGASQDLFKIGTGISQSINLNTGPLVTPPLTAGTYHGIILNKSTTNLGNNFWLTTGQFRVGNPTEFMYWSGTNLYLTGNINATGGKFTGNVQLAIPTGGTTSGTLYAGANPDTGQRIRLNSSGIFAYSSSSTGSNFQTFSLDTAGYMNAKSGLIGGWNLGETTLSNNGIVLDSTAGQISVGSAPSNSVYLSSTGNYRMWAGSQSPTDAAAKFKIGSDGTLYATGAVIGLGAGSSIDGYATTATLGNYTLSSVTTGINSRLQTVEGDYVNVSTLNTGLSSKNTTFVTDTNDAPVPNKVGDLWINGGDNNEIYTAINTTANPVSGRWTKKTNTTYATKVALNSKLSAGDYVVANSTGNITEINTNGVTVHSGLTTNNGTTNVANSGVSFNSEGIRGWYAGVPTFSVLKDGTASFAGQLSAASGTFSGVLVAGLDTVDGGGYINTGATKTIGSSTVKFTQFKALGLQSTSNSGWVSTVYPWTDNSSSLGTSLYSWNLLYLGGAAYFAGGTTIKIDANGYATLNRITLTGGYGVYSDWSPGPDNTHSLGQSTRRWTDVWAVDTSINSSDIRLKKEVASSVLGLDFIKKLRPVSYKWINGKAEALLEEKTEQRENTPGVKEDVVVMLPKISGYDSQGEEIIETVSSGGVRTHYGFIAQEVKEALDAEGIGDDFAGWVLNDKNDPESGQNLRYSEFISPLTKAVQELSDMVESLQQEVNTLKGI